VEYCHLLELLPDGRTLFLRAGVGWKAGYVRRVKMAVHEGSQAAVTLAAGDPVVVENLKAEKRFTPSRFLLEHGVVSGVTVAVAGQGRAFGILGAHTTHRRAFSEDEVHFLLSIATMLAMAVERHRAEVELQKLAAFAQLSPNAAMELAADGTITYFNDAALQLAASANQTHPQVVLPPDVREIVNLCLKQGHSMLNLQTRVEGRTFSWSFHPVLASHIVHCYVEDITERLSLEAQLRQAQKMESIGQLAAGVAHDFNNMLSIIQGHAGILMARSGITPETLESAQAVYFAAERAAGLTRQLLMFSRKNVMQPKLLDLREVVGNMSKMLQRMMGETITLSFDPPEELPQVLGDTGMLEQVLMNLAVNGRDAMSRGGALVIGLHPLNLNQAYAQSHPEAREGPFVCLRVSDNGCGMDANTLIRIFEPFFTTKEVGKGTGLGLATVYGIVKQHDGWVEVSSEVGMGTTFDIYLPASGVAVKATTAAPAPETYVQGGHETILVVEDEPVLRDMANLILQECGYDVLEAGTGREALKVWEQHQDRIVLLLTDMVMPEGMSGMDLAHRLVASKPDLKVVFTSGYNMEDLDSEIFHGGRARYLNKPYTRITLAKTVRECLDTAVMA
jgi:signal transduction histidine kinase/ActR/RegA family two-component response regulator